MATVVDRIVELSRFRSRRRGVFWRCGAACSGIARSAGPETRRPALSRLDLSRLDLFRLDLSRLDCPGWFGLGGQRVGTSDFRRHRTVALGGGPFAMAGNA